MKNWKKALLTAVALASWLGFAALAFGQSASLLPNGQQVFLDSNGAPLVGGLVYMYVPNTTTPKATWQDSGETTPNSNPVVLNAAGRALIYGSGQYRQILTDSDGNTIWDQLTSAGGTSSVGLTAPAQFAVSGSPVTSVGTLELAWNSVNANQVLAGPSAGGATVPAFRALTTADFPAGILSVLPGTVLDFAGTAVPTGYLLCDGSAVSRTTYSALFTAIGTTWGIGDGTTTFNLPSLSRRVTVGSGGAGTGTLGNTVGSVGGEESHTLSISEMPAHSHVQGNPNSAGGTYYGLTPPPSPTSTPTDRDQLIAGLVDSNSYVTSSTGGGAPHNNMQPSAVMLKMIKY